MSVCVKLTRDAVATINDFSSYVRSAEDNQTVQMDRIQAFVADELLRQNRLANETRIACEEKLARLQATLDEVRH